MKKFIDFIKRFWKAILVGLGFIATASVTFILRRKTDSVPLTKDQSDALKTMPKREDEAKKQYDEAIKKADATVQTPKAILDDFNNKFGG